MDRKGEQPLGEGGIVRIRRPKQEQDGQAGIPAEERVDAEAAQEAAGMVGGSMTDRRIRHVLDRVDVDDRRRQEVGGRTHPCRESTPRQFRRREKEPRPSEEDGEVDGRAVVRQHNLCVLHQIHRCAAKRPVASRRFRPGLAGAGVGRAEGGRAAGRAGARRRRLRGSSPWCARPAVRRPGAGRPSLRRVPGARQGRLRPAGPETARSPGCPAATDA